MSKVKANAGGKMEKTFSVPKSIFYHVASNVIDYLWLYGVINMANWTFESGINLYTSTWGLFFLVNLFVVRESIYFVLFADDIAECKRKYELTRKNYWYIAQTTGIFIIEATLGGRAGVFYWNPISFTWENYCEVFLAFYVLQFSKDIFALNIFHEMMHHSLYFLHKSHHEVHGNSNSMLAFHIDPIDLFLENLCSPIVLFSVQYAMGWEIRVHAMAIILVGIMDANIHSINPYTVLLWNPVLDYVFRCNVAHNIHHCLNKDNHMFISYHHIFPSSRKKDCDRYNEVLGTSFIL